MPELPKLKKRLETVDRLTHQDAPCDTKRSEQHYLWRPVWNWPANPTIYFATKNDATDKRRFEKSCKG